MAQNDRDGSAGSPSPESSPPGIPLEQVKALAEGGLFEEVLARSPALAKVMERLATQESKAAEIQNALGQITTALNGIIERITPPASTDAPPAGEVGTQNVLAAVAAQLLQGMIRPKDGPAAPDVLGQLKTVMEIIQAVTSVQTSLLTSAANSVRAFNRAIKTPDEAPAPTGSAPTHIQE